MVNYLDLGKKLVGQGLELGADEIEVYLSASKELSIEVANGQVETLKNAEDQGVGIRVFVENRLGYAYSSDFNEGALEDVLKKAIFNAEKTYQDDSNKLPLASEKYPELAGYDQKIGETPVAEKIEMALKMEQAAKDYDERVKITEGCAYQDSHYKVAIVSSAGIEKTYEGAYCGLVAFVVAEENGDPQTGFDLQFELNFDDLDPIKVGEGAAAKAVRMLGANHVETQKAVIVLDPYISTNFLGVLSSGFSAEAVQKGKSFFAGKVGTQICSPLVQIIDDGTLPGKITSAPFDGEGVPSERTVLIEGGVLKGYLYNNYTANKDGVSSTGNAVRGFKGTPEIGATNLYIDAGNTSKDELIKGISKGFYITEVMGMHTANPISGDFSVGASGLLIENGQFTTPFRGAALAGNLIDLFKNIDCIGDDLTFFVGRGAPTIRISEMTISGS